MPRRVALSFVPVPQKCRAKGIVERRAGFAAFHHVSIPDGSPKLATAHAPYSGNCLGAS